MNTNGSNENIQKMINKGRIKSRTRENRKITNQGRGKRGGKGGHGPPNKIFNDAFFL